MNRINLFSLSLLVLIALACSQQPEKKSTKIIGQIFNQEEGQASLELMDTTIYVNLDSSGSFSAVLPIDTVQSVIFHHGKEISNLYIRPGDDLSLTVDSNEFDETLKYTGKGAKINNFLASMELMNDSLKSLIELTKLEEDSFLVAYQRNFQEKENALQNAEVDDEAFVKWYLGSNKWELAFGLLSYPAYRSQFLKEEFTPSDKYFSYEDSLNLYDPSNLIYKNYIPYIQRRISKNMMWRFEGKGPQDVSVFIMASVEEIKDIPNEAIKEELLFRLVDRSIIQLKTEDRNILLTEWKALNPSEDRLRKVKKQLSFLDNLAKGRPAPGFTYANTEGNTVNLKDFRGKVVYIDVWATWCGPCIKEHPDMEKLQAQFEEEEVAFVSISIDESPEPWIKMVKEKGLGGHHLYADGAWKSTIIKDYGIIGIPRFILIDQEGNIVDSNAERPSGDIASEISALLDSGKAS